MNLIKVKDLTKRFNGFTAVNNISFTVREGEIFGLLGPNGAGKTTTIRILTGIFNATSGEVYVDRYNILENPIEAKQMMGIVPEMTNAYMDLSALRNLMFMGELYGIKKEQGLKRATDLLKLFSLYEKRNQKVKTFSKGMRQRLIVAMGLINEPKVLFLDEPTSGLDVESVRLIRELVRDFNNRGITIILTTHNIEEANQLCDRVAIMNHGQIIAIDRPEELKQTLKSAASVEVAFNKKVSIDQFEAEEIVTKVKKIGDKFRLYSEKTEEVIQMLVRYSQSSGARIISLNTLVPNLEDVFVKLIREAG